ncbi:MAG: FHA domain-containing protein [Oscillospiraceae bacterium]|jgi:hypothetical protein|nr:FHA domain-containing protein [Oscillospiraceae bacterium]
MNKVQCPEGHFYNADKYSECPVCNTDLISSQKSAEKPVEKPVAKEETPKVTTKSGAHKKTFSLFGSRNNSENDEPPKQEEYISPTKSQEIKQEQSPPVTPIQPQVTEQEQSPPIKPIQSQETVQKQTTSLQEEINKVVKHTDTEDVKTVAMWNAPTGDEPVVGWIVCIKGEYVGQGFDLKVGNNSIGRAVDMDIHLARESTVSRNKHCVITYEPDSQDFYLQQGDSSGLTYLNGKMVMVPQKMETRSIIKIGEAEFIFIPLCIDGFRWDEYLTKE